MKLVQRQTRGFDYKMGDLNAGICQNMPYLFQCDPQVVVPISCGGGGLIKTFKKAVAVG